MGIKAPSRLLNQYPRSGQVLIALTDEVAGVGKRADYSFRVCGDKKTG